MPREHWRPGSLTRGRPHLNLHGPSGCPAESQHWEGNLELCPPHSGTKTGEGSLQVLSRDLWVSRFPLQEAE